MRASPTTPPTTPPAMAPAFDFLEADFSSDPAAPAPAPAVALEAGPDDVAPPLDFEFAAAALVCQ